MLLVYQFTNSAGEGQFWAVKQKGFYLAYFL